MGFKLKRALAALGVAACVAVPVLADTSWHSNAVSGGGSVSTTAVTKKSSATGAPALVKTALTTEQGQAYNYTNPAGKPVKAYEIQDASVHTDIFGVADYQFNDDSEGKVKVGNLVTVDGKGAWKASEP